MDKAWERSSMCDLQIEQTLKNEGMILIRIIQSLREILPKRSSQMKVLILREIGLCYKSFQKGTLEKLPKS